MPRRQRPSRLDPARAVALVDEKLACFGPTANTAVLDAPTAQDGAAPQLREIRQVPCRSPWFQHAGSFFANPPSPSS